MHNSVITPQILALNKPSCTEVSFIMDTRIFHAEVVVKQMKASNKTTIDNLFKNLS